MYLCLRINLSLCLRILGFKGFFSFCLKPRITRIDIFKNYYNYSNFCLGKLSVFLSKQNETHHWHVSTIFFLSKIVLLYKNNLPPQKLQHDTIESLWLFHVHHVAAVG